ncbi:MAG: serpin family protein [Bacteroidales bacterium]|nr:serpin family protein [Bacteroidales bacterium]
MKRLIIVSAAALALAATACVNSQNLGDEHNEYKPLELTTKGAEFVQKGEDFTFEFIDRINTESEKDYIISPLSMQFLLGMILDGAQGETADQIAEVLGYGAGENAQVNEYCLSMLNQLPKLDKKTKIAIANAIYVDMGYDLKESYKGEVGKYYKAAVSNLDFSDGASALKEINGWCSKNTNGMIPKILDEVSPEMLAYLLNALYFKGQWKDKFSKSRSAEETFTNEAGTKSQVTMMKTKKEFPYTENEIFQAVRLPYGNGAYAMTVLLPKKGHTVADISATLRKSDWDGIRYGFDYCEVDLWLPRFETKYNIKLNDLLSAMGMPDSFDPAKADFKAMSGDALCLSFVQQHAAIKVDEEGTEAAAVSSAGMLKEAAMPMDNAVFHADHPFLYLITESSTGVVLFAGRYSNVK